MAGVPIVYSTDEERGLAETIRGAIAAKMPDHSFMLALADERPDAEVWIKLEATSQMGLRTGDFVRMSVFHRGDELNAGSMHGPRSLLENPDRLDEWAAFASEQVESGLQPKVPISDEAIAAFSKPMEELANFIQWLDDSPPRVERSLPELAQRLADHTSLLIEYIEKVRRDGDRRYLGEIAGKLRLLVLGRRSKNKPLLLLLAQETGHELTYRVNAPPRFVFSEGVVGGERASLTNYLDSMAFTVGGNTLTNAEVIMLWSQQHGSAHEDWYVDRRLLALTANPMQVDGSSTAEEMLLSIATTVASVAKGYLNALTPEALDAAERSRAG
jgi:hypothetical protein